MLFSAAITVAAFVPLFTMQGVEGQIFGPMARTYGYALAGALIATFTVTPVLASLLLPEHVKEVETDRGACAARASTRRRCAGRSTDRKIMVAHRRRSSWSSPGCWLRGSAREFLPALEEGNLLDPRLDAADHVARSRRCRR